MEALLAVLETARNLPAGQGRQTHNVPGFVISVASNHDDADTFMLSIQALFAPQDAPDGGLIVWTELTPDEVAFRIAAAISFSQRHFSKPVEVADELISEIESFLGN